nr:hypothetical protein [Tanacetum cinerariifolium]
MQAKQQQEEMLEWGGRGVKEKKTVVAAKDVVSPLVIDEPVVVAKQSSLVDTSIPNFDKISLSSYPPLPMHGSTLAGNNPGMCSYANVTGAPKRLLKGLRILVMVSFWESEWLTPLVLTISMDGLNAMLKNGPCFICNHPLILKKCNLDVNLLKEKVRSVPVWVKLHGVLVTTFSEDGLGVITVKIGSPIMLESYTYYMCLQSWGRPVSKKPTASTSGNKKKGVEPTKEVSNSNPFNVINSVVNDVELRTNGGTSNLASNRVNSSGSLFWNVETSSTSTTPIVDKIGKLEKLIIDEKVTLVDDDGKPLKKVDYSGDHDSEDKVESVDNHMARFMAS